MLYSSNSISNSLQAKTNKQNADAGQFSYNYKEMNFKSDYPSEDNDLLQTVYEMPVFRIEKILMREFGVQILKVQTQSFSVPSSCMSADTDKGTQKKSDVPKTPPLISRHAPSYSGACSNKNRRTAEPPNAKGKRAADIQIALIGNDNVGKIKTATSLSSVEHAKKCGLDRTVCVRRGFIRLSGIFLAIPPPPWRSPKNF